MEELNKFRQFLTEGKKKTIKEASFGNDPKSRYEYIRPLMSKLPDSARTEAMIDGMEEALAEDDKMEFDFYFVEAMKMLGLEKELMDDDVSFSVLNNYSIKNNEMSEPDYEDYAPDSALGPNPSFVEEAEGEKTDYMKRRRKMSDYYVNPEAEEIDDDDLGAAANYFDSLAENDKVLDGVIKEGTWSLGGPKEIDSIIKGLQGIIKMADDAQTKRNAAGRGFVNALQNQLKDEGWNQRLYKILGDDSFFDHYDVAKAAAEVRDFDNVKNKLGDAIARAEELKAAIMKNSGIKEGLTQDILKKYPKKYKDEKAVKAAAAKLMKNPKFKGKGIGPVLQALLKGKEYSPEQKANVFVRENKALKASNDLEKTLNSVVDELTDDQIDSITNMILDLRDKVKAKKK